MNKRRTAFIIVDIQKGLFRSSPKIYRGEELIERVNSCIEGCEDSRVSCWYVQHENKGLLKKGSDGWTIHPGVRLIPEAERVYKDRGDAFQGTDFAERLKRRGIERLVISGLTTHGCIRATCRGSLAAGFETILLSDCHSSYHAEAGKLIDTWNDKLSGEGCRLWSSRDFLSFLTEKESRP